MHKVLLFDFEYVTFKIHFKNTLHDKDENCLYILLSKRGSKKLQPNLYAWIMASFV